MRYNFYIIIHLLAVDMIINRCHVIWSSVHFLWSTGGGVWAVYPVVFSISQFCGIFHSTITVVLAVATISSFSVAAFRSPGTPPNVLWGSYPVVEKGDLENYTFCHYCSKPKSPRTHHCRSCGMCVLDMDHHCPFVSSSFRDLLKYGTISFTLIM